MIIELHTCNHLGDALCLTAAMANLAEVQPDVKFRYDGNYADVFQGNPLMTPAEAEMQLACNYRDHGAKDNTAQTGNLCDGLTASLAKSLGLSIPANRKYPVIYMTDKEIAWGKASEANGAIILNTNCQRKSSVKAYPWWTKVTELLPDFRFILIGSQEERDIRYTGKFGKNVIDWRGCTTTRQLFAAVWASKGVVSPPSSACHIAAAFDHSMVIVTGAREPVKLTEYPWARHVTSVCVGSRGKTYDKSIGCMHFVTTDERSCERIVEIDGRPYASCMACIPPEAIASEIENTFGV